MALPKNSRVFSVLYMSIVLLVATGMSAVLLSQIHQAEAEISAMS